MPLHKRPGKQPTGEEPLKGVFEPDKKDQQLENSPLRSMPNLRKMLRWHFANFDTNTSSVVVTNPGVDRMTLVVSALGS